MARMRALSILVLFLAGCSDPPTEPDIRVSAGRFQSTISGSVSAEVQGTAEIDSLFGSRQVTLIADGESFHISFQRPILGDSDFDFQVGTHSIGSILGGGVLDVTLSASPAREDFYMATSGRVRITESTPEHVIAHFDFRAMGDPGGTRKQIRVRGAFHAIRTR